MYEPIILTVLNYRTHSAEKRKKTLHALPHLFSEKLIFLIFTIELKSKRPEITFLLQLIAENFKMTLEIFVIS